MRHANSNLNILKKNRNSKTIKLNNFLKPPSSSNNFNSPITTKNSNNKHILYNLLYKDNSKVSLYKTKNTTNTYKNNTNEISSFGGNKNSFSNKNLINNSISSGNSMNFIDNNAKRGHINIRLKLNNQIINNNIGKKKKSKNNAINFEMIEKIKEKDSLINKLQKELCISQEFLNKLQKDKQKELAFTYNSIKSLDNISNLKNDYQLSDFFIPTSEKNDKILKTNFNKFEINKSKKKLKYWNSKNNLSKNNKKNKNLKTLLKIDSLVNLNTNNNSKKSNKKYIQNSLSGFHKNNINKYQCNFSTTNYLKCFSSSAKRFFPHGHEQYQSCISLTRNTLSNKKSLHSPKQNQNHIITLSPSKKIFTSPSLKNLIKKCNLLKTKANNILANYISLTEYIIKTTKNKK